MNERSTWILLVTTLSLATACARPPAATMLRDVPRRVDLGPGAVTMYIGVRHAIMKTRPDVVVCFPALSPHDVSELLARGLAATIQTDTTCSARPSPASDDGLLVIERIERGDTSRVFGVFTQKVRPRWWREQFIVYRHPAPGGHQFTVGEFAAIDD